MWALLCWQHSYRFTEKNNCHRATEGLISQAALPGCNQKADSSECCCPDPAWKSPGNLPVLLSFLSSDREGERPTLSSATMSHVLSAQQNRPCSWLGSLYGMGIKVWEEGPPCGEVLLQHFSLCSPDLIWPCVYICEDGCHIPGMWVVSKVVLAAQDSS